jgi:hypothetical protein
MMMMMIMPLFQEFDEDDVFEKLKVEKKIGDQHKEGSTTPTQNRIYSSNVVVVATRLEATHHLRVHYSSIYKFNNRSSGLTVCWIQR